MIQGYTAKVIFTNLSLFSEEFKETHTTANPSLLAGLILWGQVKSMVRNDLVAPWSYQRLIQTWLTSRPYQAGNCCWNTGHCNMHWNSTSTLRQKTLQGHSGLILTLSRRHLFSLMAPMQPTKPMIMTNVPVMISRLAADRDGKEEERVAKFPWVTASQMPTPRIPQPPNWENKEKQRNSVIMSKQSQILTHINMAAVEQLCCGKPSSHT